MKLVMTRLIGCVCVYGSIKLGQLHRSSWSAVNDTTFFDCLIISYFDDIPPPCFIFLGFVVEIISDVVFLLLEV